MGGQPMPMAPMQEPVPPPLPANPRPLPPRPMMQSDMQQNGVMNDLLNAKNEPEFPTSQDMSADLMGVDQWIKRIGEDLGLDNACDEFVGFQIDDAKVEVQHP